MRPLCMLLLMLLFSGCFDRNDRAESAAKAEPEAEPASAPAGSPAPAYDAQRDRAMGLAMSLDDRQLAAQVIISGIDGKGRLTPDMRMLLAECPAGGIMLFKYNLDAENDAIRELIAETAALVAALTAIPPFVAVDHEGGAVNRFRRGVAYLPPAGSYGEIAQGRGRDTALSHITGDSFAAGREIRALGVTMNLAPVAEYLNEENRDFLNNRSYGTDPAFVAAAAAAFIEGMEQAGVFCVVKHFPGSAGADPHLYPSVLKGDRVALAELSAPVASLIRGNQARAIMVSHSAVPAIDRENIASLSSAVMGGWLREELGFEGLIICDDFSMAAVGSHSLKPEMAAVLSLAAGADMVLVWPPDLRRTHRAILAALDDGRLPRERLREAAGRIIFEKIRMGVVKNEE